MNTYNQSFFAERFAEVEIARIIAEPLIDLLRPASVVDLGTASGSWLAAVKTLGVERVRGIDGPWVPPEKRHITPDEFVAADLETDIPDLGRFDLAISTEVLEHISEPASVRAVDWLCKSAPAVLFSAAVPGQGGSHHVNEAWQSHWAGLFKARGFETYDIIRPAIWSDERLPAWYRQNLLLMADEETGKRLGLVPSDLRMLDCVHPALFMDRAALTSNLEARTIKARLRSLRRRIVGAV